jgi:hypothetical protein
LLDLSVHGKSATPADDHQPNIRVARAIEEAVMHRDYYVR